VAEDPEAAGLGEHGALAPREAAGEDHPAERGGRQPPAHEVHAAVEQAADGRLVTGLAAQRKRRHHALPAWATRALPGSRRARTIAAATSATAPRRPRFTSTTSAQARLGS